MSALAAGTKVCDGRYRLDEVLGRGGMAIVWRATDLQLERPVAIKVISDVLASDPAFVARFEREARLAASLNHPNLVKLFDFSAEGERPLLVMEHVGGGTLAERRTPVDAHGLAHDLLDALAHIHAAGIVHRDVKPANVLVGTDGRPRLTDFGIARGDDQTGLTLTGQVMGTVRYIAPEVVAGGPSTPQSDLYSLGVLLGEVAGPRPGRELARLITWLSDPEPARRPASAQEALAGLDPTGPTRVLETREPRGRRPQLVPLAIAAAVAAGVIVIFAGGGGGGDQPKQPSQATSSGHRLPSPAAPGAPLDAQLTRLQQIVAAAPKR